MFVARNFSSVRQKWTEFLRDGVIDTCHSHTLDSIVKRTHMVGEKFAWQECKILREDVKELRCNANTVCKHTHTHTRHVIRMLQNNNFNYFIRYEIIVNARAFASGFVCNGKSHARGVYMQYFNLNFRMFLKRERERKRKRRERTRSNRLRSNTHTLTPEWNKRHSNNSNKIKK